MATVVDSIYDDDINCSSCGDEMEVQEVYSIRVIERQDGTMGNDKSKNKYIFCSKECCARWLLEDS